MKKILAFILLNICFSNFAFALEDELIKFLDSNLKIQQVQKAKIEDDFLPKLKGEVRKNEIILIEDEFLPKTNNKIKKVNLNFDFENLESFVFYISPKNFYTTKKDLKLGQNVEFILKNDVEINKIKYKQGEIITSRVEMISLNDLIGVPAELILGNFKFKKDNQKIDSELIIKGADRTKWAYPVSCVLNSFFLSGYLLYLIRGGHAKLKPNKQYLIKIN